MKRVLSIILTLAMLLSMFTVFAVTNVAAATVITNQSPAITATVGTKITLSNYSVTFDGDSSATSGVTWKDSSGTAITTFTPSSKGVTKLTAASGSKSKTIYVVAKNASDTEYVLYEASMSSFASLDALKTAGWSLPSASSAYSLSDGNLLMTGSGSAYAYLPSWLGDFGNYGFSATAKIVTANDNSRWFSLMYRASNRSGTYNHYQFALRNNTTATSGLEFAELTSGGWNVMKNVAGTYPQLTDEFRNVSIKVNNGYGYYINGEQVLYMDQSTLNSKATNILTKGYLGFTMNGGQLAISSVKVTVQDTAVPQDAVKLHLVNNNRAELNTVNPIANVENISDISALDAAKCSGNVYISASKVSNFTTFFNKCREKQIIPNIYVASSTDVTNVINGINATNFVDVTVTSTDASLLKSIRSSKSIVRTGLVITNPASYASEHDIRVAVRSAPATFCIINVKYATKALVSEIQEYAVAVWVSVNSTPGTADYELDIMTAATSGANGILSNSASECAALINENLVENTMTRTPVMIGHRGNPTQAPENTLSGFIKAYENGADVFEVDVDITKDGHVIIMHDSTLTRTTTYTGSATVGQMTLAEVKSYYILDKSGNATTEKVPTLKEVCDYFQDKDCKIFIEYKGNTASNVTTTASLLKTYGMEYLVDCISFNYSLLTKMQESCPGMSTGYLLSSVTDGSTPEAALSGLYTYLASAQAVNSTINPARGIVVSDGNLFTTYATDRGMTVWPWTYSYSNNDVGFFSGCDGVTTDDMQWVTNMAKYLEADTISLVPGQTYSGGGVYSVAYGDARTEIALKDTVFSVVGGDDCVSVVDGKLVAKAVGTAKVIFGYKTTTTTGKNYVVYTQPVDVTVNPGDANSLKALIENCKDISIYDYSTETINTIRSYIEEGNSLISSSASSAEIEALIVKLSQALNDRCTEVIVSKDKSYTTTAPDRGDGNNWNDDGSRLTDGDKGGTDGGTLGYSGWNAVGTPVEVIVDLEEVTEVDKFRVYGAFGNWGIPTPEGLTVRVSDDKNEWHHVGNDNVKVIMSDTDTWDTYIYEIVCDKSISARYVKFTVSPSTKFIWLDEVEVVSSKGYEAAENSIYIDAFNTKVASGSGTIFTPDFGTISVETANISWATWLIAEYDSTKKVYVVKSHAAGYGAETPAVTLGTNEIMIAGHQWDTCDTAVDPVVGSKKNCLNIAYTSVGDTLVMNGISINNKALDDVAPHIVINHTHKYNSELSCKNSLQCSECGVVSEIANAHTEGEWTVVTEAEVGKQGLKELRCSECGELIASEIIPAIPADTDNLAYGKSYTLSGVYADSTGTVPYPDTNNSELTDGVNPAADAIYSDTSFVGFNRGSEGYKANGYADITVDLGSVYAVGKFVTTVGTAQLANGITAPSKVEVYVSSDNSAWTKAGETAVVDTEADNTLDVTVQLENGVAARYVQFRIYATDGKNWIFVSEVEVYPGKLADPEPDPTYPVGDVNADGQVDSADYLIVKRACFGTYALSEDEEKRANVNGDTAVDSVDYVCVKRIAFGSYTVS